MGRLNIDKAIESGKKSILAHSHYCLKASDLNYLYEQKDDWAKIANAFYLGVCQGEKVAKKKMKSNK